jgi:hypothetical protein
MTYGVNGGLLLELELLKNKLVILYCDNKTAINIANNPIQYDRTKHTEIDQHFIKDKLNDDIMCMSFIGIKEQIADVFTKGLSIIDFSYVIGKMGMINIYASF